MPKKWANDIEVRTAIQSSHPIEPSAKPILLCFSHLRWDFVYQRPQHLLSRAAKSFRVVMMEEPEFGDYARPRLHLKDRPEGVTVALPQLPNGLGPRAVIGAQQALIDGLVAALGAPAVAWYYSPSAMAFSSHVPARVRVYDCMDELSNFKNAPPMLPLMEKRLFGRVDLVFTGGMSLYEAKRNQHPSVHAFPSSIDRAHFDQARAPDRSEPADQAGIPHPRVGFFGVIDERMDLDFVGRMADLRPDWQFAMIGPVVKIDPKTLPRRANIHWLGGKSYSELPAYLGGWDLGFMPFALNDATRFISPTKTPEFLSAGLPVLSTPIADVVKPYGENGLVEIASTAEDMVRAGDRLLAGCSPEWRAKVDRHLATTSWDRTWQSMHRLIREVLLEKAALSDRQTRRVAAVPAGEPAHV
jgi:glycosyltransferase involved in cell wall biosynthesis